MAGQDVSRESTEMHAMESGQVGNLGDGRRLLDVADAAIMLGICERHLRSEIAEGRMPHRRLGGSKGVGGRIKILYPDDIETYLDAAAAGPAAA